MAEDLIGRDELVAKQSAVDSTGGLKRLSIDGVRFRPVRPVAHEDGHLVEVARADWPVIGAPVVQVHITTTLPGHVRAWGLHQRSTDRLFVVKGLIRFAVFDGRTGSKTFGQVNTLLVSELSPGLLIVEPNLYHGWKNIGDTEAAIINMPEKLYDYERPDALDLPWDSPEAAALDSPRVVSQSPAASGRPRRPLVSVIIATFNWSGALRCAISSVLRQTEQDFEILVVGDACTDDSEEVVESFGDPRIVWMNLPENTGSQQGPNNAGLAAAKGEWIAYLGHDDIWGPRHLDSTVAAARAAGAQAAAGGMIMYGPPGSGVTRTAGIFGDDHCSELDFVPPSALVHRRTLVDEIGPWIDPRTLRLPTDCDFFRRARAASPVASNNEITVFKFNAAARRNAYQIKSTAEQEGCLAGLERGERFVAEELTKVLASMVAGRWSTMKLPGPQDHEPGELFHANRIAKGAEPRFRADQLRSLARAERFRLDHEPTSYEWLPVQQHPTYGSFRWTGFSERSTIELPIQLDRPMAVRLHVLFSGIRLTDVVVEAQGAAIETAIQTAPDGTWVIDGVIDPARRVSTVAYVQIALCGLASAQRVNSLRHANGRHVGLALDWIEIGPAT